MYATEIEDTVVSLNGKSNRIISGKYYYAMFHAHPMVHGSLFIDTGHGMLMIASIVQLLIDALSQIM